jgi:hypothetical protein
MDNNNFTPESFQETIRAFQKSRIILTGFELGIFSHLESTCMTSKQLAQKIEADERATERLLNSLVALGLLEKKNNVFSNSQFASEYLVEDKPKYIQGIGHSANLWHTWSTLTEVVKKGKTIIGRNTSERNDEWLKPFIGAMHYRGSLNSDATVHNLNLTNVKKVLDIGGGSAAYSMAFVRSKPSIKATVFDLPDVVFLTKEYIKNAGMQQQIDTVAGNYMTDDLPKGYDMVFLSAIVHSNSYDENMKLIKNCADALTDKGQVVLQDYIMNEDRTEPAGGAVFAINMLVGTLSGDTYTEKEVKEWFDNSGLKFEHKLPAPMGNSLMIARK